MNARGGDIDLYVETHETDPQLIIKKRAKFFTKLLQSIGEQKIDIIIKLTSDQFTLPIYQEATTKGIQLI